MATVPTVLTAAIGDDLTAAGFNAGVGNALTFLLRGAPFCAINQGTAQAAFAASTFTSITFDTEVADTDSQHSTSSNTSRINIGTTLGFYLVTGVVAFASNSTGGTRRAQLALNGTGIGGSQGISPVSSSIVSAAINPTVVQATSSGDYIELQGWHDASSSVATLVSGSYRCSLTALFVRAP